MLVNIFGNIPNYVLLFTGSVISFLFTFLAFRLFMDKLPRDHGRAYAVNGGKSVGKPRGGGIIFIITFVIAALLILPFKVEYLMYLGLTFVAMMTGYLDDASDKPWGELKKGILDLVISVLLAGTYIMYNSCDIFIPFTKITVTLPIPVFAVLTVILVWASINVTNCTDGVDGLCGSLSVITLSAFYFVCCELSVDKDFPCAVVILVAALLAYLWFNSSPSILLMGDAGSRAIGFFIAVTALKSGNPLVYLLLALVMIIDGGLGLIKLTVIRTFKVKDFMSKLRTPVHDHMRKNLGWSDTQVVMRFIIIQVVIAFTVVYLC